MITPRAGFYLIEILIPTLYHSPHSGVPAAGHHVHQVHPDYAAPGAVLRPDRAPAEAPRAAPLPGRRHRPHRRAQERDGQPRVLRVPLL